MERIGPLLRVGTGDRHAYRGGRRRHRRFRLNAEVTVVSPIASDGVVLNASAGGLRVVLDEAPAVGADCEILVHLGSGQRSHEMGRVVWRHEHPDGWVVGLEFIEV